jgi:hypothetical protein
MKAELDFSARAVLLNIKSARFNFQAETLREARASFASEIIKTVKLNKEDFLKLLQSAAQLQAQYLARPHKILKEVIFADQTERATQEIEDRLKNFCDYSYLLDVFAQYLERKKPETLSVEKFEKTISEIDSRICLSTSNEDVLPLFKPLYEFYKLANENRIDTQTLMEFLSEKKMSDCLKRLDLARQNGIESLSEVSLSELLLAPPEMFESQQSTPQKIEAQTLEPQTVETETVETETAESQSQIPEAADAAISVEPVKIEEPIKSESADNQEPNREKFAEPEPQISARLDAPQIDFFELAKQEIRAQKKDDEPNLRDIQSLISADERKSFIKRLFKGSEEEYNQAIRVINEKKTWREASLYIDHEIFSRFKVDEFSSEAVAFIDIVFERFQIR